MLAISFSVVMILFAAVGIVAMVSLWLFQRKRRRKSRMWKQEEAEIIHLSMKVGESKGALQM